MDRGWFKGVERTEIISLGMLEPIGPITWQRLFTHFPSGAHLLKAKKKELATLGLTDLQQEAITARPQNIAAIERLLGAKKIQLITIDDPSYPPLLKEISDPPLWLYGLGDLSVLKKTSLTIVGSRKPTNYALSALEIILSEQLANNIVFNSGLAYGIDKAAHQWSLKNKGLTTAVLAGGLDSIYPTDHYQLAQKIIAAGGLLLSEYPPLSRPRPYRFPVRNRILAGLSRATVVVEANIKSGSLTTAKSALDYNRDLFAVPGDITRQQAEGTNFLIKKGAALLDEPQELDDYFSLKKSRKSSQKIDNTLQQLLDLVTNTPLTVDQIAQLSGQSVETVLGSITQLELFEAIRQTESGAYVALKNKK